jgi:regulator of cell morphogenesis and NO signaling
MFLQTFEITPATTVSEIVAQNYRTADIFQKYEIEYCCGGKWPLETACMIKGLEFEKLKKELQDASRSTQLPPHLSFETWSIDFLTSYIIHVHHQHLKQSLPATEEILNHFTKDHEKKYPYMLEVQALFAKLKEELIPHIQYEEEIIFPYICQVSHAFENNDTYAKLLVKTLRKPLDKVMNSEHEMLTAPVLKIRNLTNSYSPPEKACISHKVVLERLKENDNDLMQHVYLENDILFPRALQIEKELLQ